MITKEQVIKQYGGVELEFSSYYRYTFHYKKELDDGTLIFGSYGGSSEDIYRYDVSKDSVVKVSYFENSLTYMEIVKDGTILFKYSD